MSAVARRDEAAIPVMTVSAVETVRRMETLARTLEQVPFVTKHLLHADLYTRTVTIPAGTLITGAQVKRGTVLIVSGDALIYVGVDKPLQVKGHTVLPASAGRKQAFFAQTELTITAVAACSADTVAEAEAFLTDEAHLLPSLDDAGKHIIERTGE